MTKYTAIILPDRIFISDAVSKSWNVVNLASYFLFDGQKALPTRKHEWFELPNLPKKVERIVNPPQTISYYKLKDGFVSTDKLPQTGPPFLILD